MKYKGKPNPRNYNYFELSHNASGSLCITLKQHEQVGKLPFCSLD